MLLALQSSLSIPKIQTHSRIVFRLLVRRVFEEDVICISSISFSTFPPFFCNGANCFVSSLSLLGGAAASVQFGLAEDFPQA